jgi:putative hemolysin
LESDSYHSVIGLLGSITFLKPDGGLILSLIVVLLLLLISGMVSGSEVAFFSLTPGEIDKLKKAKGRLSNRVIRLLEQPDRLLATILITNNFVNVGIVVLSSFITNSLFSFDSPQWVVILIKVVAITALILFFSEIFPKIYANRFSIPFARITAPGLSFFSTLFRPISNFLIYSTSIVNKRLIKHTGNISINDLSDALELTESNLSDEKDILKGIVKFGNIDVCEIMRPRVDTIAVDLNMNFKDLLQLINKSGYSRIPVYENTSDQIYYLI